MINIKKFILCFLFTFICNIVLGDINIKNKIEINVLDYSSKKQLENYSAKLYFVEEIKNDEFETLDKIRLNLFKEQHNSEQKTTYFSGEVNKKYCLIISKFGYKKILQEVSFNEEKKINIYLKKITKLNHYIKKKRKFGYSTLEYIELINEQDEIDIDIEKLRNNKKDIFDELKKKIEKNNLYLYGGIFFENKLVSENIYLNLNYKEKYYIRKKPIKVSENIIFNINEKNNGKEIKKLYLLSSKDFFNNIICYNKNEILNLKKILSKENIKSNISGIHKINLYKKGYQIYNFEIEVIKYNKKNRHLNIEMIKTNFNAEKKLELEPFSFGVGIQNKSKSISEILFILSEISGTKFKYKDNDLILGSTFNEKISINEIINLIVKSNDLVLEKINNNEILLKNGYTVISGRVLDEKLNGISNLKMDLYLDGWNKVLTDKNGGFYLKKRGLFSRLMWVILNEKYVAPDGRNLSNEKIVWLNKNKGELEIVIQKKLKEKSKEKYFKKEIIFKDKTLEYILRKISNEIGINLKIIKSMRNKKCNFFIENGESLDKVINRLKNSFFIEANYFDDNQEIIFY